MPYSYLALGDSYTIGESVPLYENFPYETVKELRNAGYDFYAPEIIAKTGWTTDELQAGISNYPLRGRYDFVTLLIGVNNQYRGGSIEVYAHEFAALLNQAIAFTGNERKRVFVLSIPDWGVTPFAEGRDREQISKQVDAFNGVATDITRRQEVHFLNITTGTREAATDKSLLAGDQLHPSGKEYTRWANQLAAGFINQLK
jgi:lysophospholipase L1-like esterase